MKKLFVCIPAVFACFLSIAQPPNVPAKTGSTFGEKVTAENAITVEQLEGVFTGKAEGSRKAAVKIKGVVTDVCSMEGCWIKVKSPDGKIMVRMKEHRFTVPLALNGKTVIIDGVAEEKMTSIDQLKHYATDAGKSTDEINAIKEPRKEIIVDAKGLLVL